MNKILVSSAKFLQTLGFICIAVLAYTQPVYVYKAPFKIARMNVEYSDSSSSFLGDVYIDDFGNRVAADYKGIYENKTFKKRIIRNNSFWFYFIHSKKVIVKFPVNSTIKYYDRNQMIKISDTIYLRYNCDYCTFPSDSLIEGTAIFFNQLLLKLDVSNGISYKVNEIEVLSIPDNIFAIPHNYLLKELNYNFFDF